MICSSESPDLNYKFDSKQRIDWQTLYTCLTRVKSERIHRVQTLQNRKVTLWELNFLNMHR